jgi:hypothetical protein
MGRNTALMGPDEAQRHCPGLAACSCTLSKRKPRRELISSRDAKKKKKQITLTKRTLIIQLDRFIAIQPNLFPESPDQYSLHLL